jgi:hypothetical protein
LIGIGTCADRGGRAAGIGLVVIVLVAVLARRTWLIAHREEGASITEAQARENAAPLTTAILALDSRKHKGRR